MAGDSGDSAIDAVPGGLVIRSSKKENSFKAPAPRTSLLGTSCRILSGTSGTIQITTRDVLQAANYRFDKVSHAGLDKLAQQKREEKGEQASALGEESSHNQLIAAHVSAS